MNIENSQYPLESTFHPPHKINKMMNLCMFCMENYIDSKDIVQHNSHSNRLSICSQKNIPHNFHHILCMLLHCYPASMMANKALKSLSYKKVSLLMDNSGIPFSSQCSNHLCTHYKPHLNIFCN